MKFGASRLALQPLKNIVGVPPIIVQLCSSPEDVDCAFAEATTYGVLGHAQKLQKAHRDSRTSQLPGLGYRNSELRPLQGFHDKSCALTNHGRNPQQKKPAHRLVAPARRSWACA